MEDDGIEPTTSALQRRSASGHLPDFRRLGSRRDRSVINAGHQADVPRKRSRMPGIGQPIRQGVSVAARDQAYVAVPQEPGDSVQRQTCAEGVGRIGVPGIVERRRWRSDPRGLDGLPPRVPHDALGGQAPSLWRGEDDLGVGGTPGSEAVAPEAPRIRRGQRDVCSLDSWVGRSRTCRPSPFPGRAISAPGQPQPRRPARPRPSEAPGVRPSAARCQRRARRAGLRASEPGGCPWPRPPRRSRCTRRERGSARVGRPGRRSVLARRSTGWTRCSRPARQRAGPRVGPSAPCVPSRRSPRRRARRASLGHRAWRVRRAVHPPIAGPRRGATSTRTCGSPRA